MKKFRFASYILSFFLLLQPLCLSANDVIPGGNYPNRPGIDKGGKFQPNDPYFENNRFKDKSWGCKWINRKNPLFRKMGFSLRVFYRDIRSNTYSRRTIREETSGLKRFGMRTKNHINTGLNVFPFIKRLFVKLPNKLETMRIQENPWYYRHREPKTWVGEEIEKFRFLKKVQRWISSRRHQDTPEKQDTYIHPNPLAHASFFWRGLSEKTLGRNIRPGILTWIVGMGLGPVYWLQVKSGEQIGRVYGEHAREQVLEELGDEMSFSIKYDIRFTWIRDLLLNKTVIDGQVYSGEKAKDDAMYVQVMIKKAQEAVIAAENKIFNSKGFKTPAQRKQNSELSRLVYQDEKIWWDLVGQHPSLGTFNSLLKTIGRGDLEAYLAFNETGLSTAQSRNLYAVHQPTTPTSSSQLSLIDYDGLPQETKLRLRELEYEMWKTMISVPDFIDIAAGKTLSNRAVFELDTNTIEKIKKSINHYAVELLSDGNNSEHAIGKALWATQREVLYRYYFEIMRVAAKADNPSLSEDRLLPIGQLTDSSGKELPPQRLDIHVIREDTWSTLEGWQN